MQQTMTLMLGSTQKRLEQQNEEERPRNKCIDQEGIKIKKKLINELKQIKIIITKQRLIYFILTDYIMINKIKHHG